MSTSDSAELRTLEKCTPQLETALKGLERNLVHFLKDECFILDDVRDCILDARSILDKAEKAGELVKWIKNRVKLDPESYHILVNRFKQGGNLYRPIVRKLEEEYRRQQLIGEGGNSHDWDIQVRKYCGIPHDFLQKSCKEEKIPKNCTGEKDRAPILSSEDVSLWNKKQQHKQHKSPDQHPVSSSSSRQQCMPSMSNEQHPLSRMKQQVPPQSNGQQKGLLLSSVQQQQPLLSSGQQQGPLLSSGQQQGPLLSSGQQQRPPLSSGQHQVPLVSIEQQGCGQQQGPLPSSGQQQQPLLSSEQQQVSLPSNGQQQWVFPSSEQQQAPLPISGQQQGPLPNSGQQQGSLLSSGQQQRSLPSSGQQEGSLLNSGQQQGSLPSSGKQQGSLPSSTQQQGPLSNGGQQHGSLPNSGQKQWSLPNSWQQQGPLQSSRQQQGSLLSSEQQQGSLLSSEQQQELLPNSGQQQGPLPNSGQQQGPLPNSGQQQGPLPNSGQQQGPLPSSRQQQGSLLSNEQQLGSLLSSGQQGSLPSSGQQEGPLPSSGQQRVPQQQQDPAASPEICTIAGEPHTQHVSTYKKISLDLPKLTLHLPSSKTSTTSRFCYSVGQPLSTHRQHSYSATDVTPSSSDSLPANLVVHQHHFVTVVDADCPHARCTHSHVDNSGSQSCSDLSSRELGTEGGIDEIIQLAEERTNAAPSHSSKMHHAYAFSRYKKYLQSYYHKNMRPKDDKLAVTPCSQFIDLALVDKESNAVSSPLNIDGIVSEDSQFILVEGLTGMGKSTLCWELCRKWDTLKSLQNYEIVLLLKLRENRIQNATSLNELFRHSDKALSQTVVDEVFRCEGEGILLIFDGFDEMPNSIIEDESSLIMELISGTCLPAATRLLTSRPSALNDKEDFFPQVDRCVKIHGFTDENKSRFIEDAFKLDLVVLDHFKKSMFSDPVVKSLMDIPINCAIIAQVYKDVWRNEKLMPKTMTQLYSTLIVVLIKRHMIERGEWVKSFRVPKDLNSLPEDVIFCLERVSKLAYDGLFSKSTQLVFADADVGENFQPLGLLSETKEMCMCEGERTSYSFLHLSIQEFLAAWFVSRHPELWSHDIYGSTEPYLEVFSQFLAGMIGCKKFSVEKRRLPTDTADFIALSRSHNILRYFYEAHGGAQELNSLFRDPCYCTSLYTPMDMHVFGYILAHGSAQWKVEISTACDTLVSSLEKHLPADKRLAGSILSLKMILKKGNLSLNAQILPNILRQSITTLTLAIQGTCCITPSLLADVSAFRNLKKISLDIEIPNENDHLLYRELAKASALESLSIVFEHITLKGIQELSAMICSGSTLQSVQLVQENWGGGESHKMQAAHVQLELGNLVNAVLSSPKVKDVDIGIPFAKFSSELSSNIERMAFDVPQNTFAQNIDSLCCSVADVCNELPYLTSLKIRIFPDNTYPFMTLLNDSLYCNPSIKELTLMSYMPAKTFFDLLSPMYPYCASSLPCALRKNPEIARANLKRSDSVLQNQTFDFLPPVMRSDSAPADPSGIQNMHPVLYQALGIGDGLTGSPYY